MPEQCDPYVYFRRVRPYIHGWKDNPALKDGVLYEGVERFKGMPQVFRGQTGSQSSIVPSMDALLGVGHGADPLRAYLDELHIYRPPAHRRFIDDVRAQSGLRAFVRQAGHRGLTQAYNAAVQAVADFRSLHLEYAASYINKQGGRTAGNDTEVGTGGTPFMKYLKKHRDETRANLIDA
jgi:indoleamine 2,3-dioxygenase